MIKEKKKLTGNLNAKQSLSGSLSNSVIYVEPITQEKEVTPTRNVQEIVPDTGYTGLSKIKVKGYTVKTAEKTITESGTYDASDENLDGYSKVKALISYSGFSGSCDRNGLKKLGWTDEEIDYYQQNGIQWNESENDIFKVEDEDLNMQNYKNTRYLSKNTDKTNFKDWYALIGIPNVDFSKVTTCVSTFNNCYSLTTIPLINTSNVTSMSSMFSGCVSLKTIPLLNTSNLINMDSTFNCCYSLKTIPLLNTSKVTNMRQTFGYCYSLQTIPQLDTSNVINASNMFKSCSLLRNVPLLNFESVTNIKDVFYYCDNLTNMGGLLNLGEAYLNTAATNNSNYTLDISRATVYLTEQSLINVLTNLYDIATKGCQSQKVVLGTTNLAKLTSGEGQAALSNAQSKGWTVS